MICRVCHGAGSFIAIQPNFVTKNKSLKFFTCPGCNGLGTITVDAPAKIRMHGVGKKIAKVNKQLILIVDSTFKVW